MTLAATGPNPQKKMKREGGKNGIKDTDGDISIYICHKDLKIRGRTLGRAYENSGAAHFSPEIPRLSLKYPKNRTMNPKMSWIVKEPITLCYTFKMQSHTT